MLPIVVSATSLEPLREEIGRRVSGAEPPREPVGPAGYGIEASRACGVGPLPRYTPWARSLERLLGVPPAMKRSQWLPPWRSHRRAGKLSTQEPCGLEVKARVIFSRAETPSLHLLGHFFLPVGRGISRAIQAHPQAAHLIMYDVGLGHVFFGQFHADIALGRCLEERP